jgi:aromatic-amino-acid transaminase
MLATLKQLPAQRGSAPPLLPQPDGCRSEHGAVGCADSSTERRQVAAFPRHCLPGIWPGLDEDAYAIRALSEAGISFFVSNSFPRIFHSMVSAAVAYPSSAKARKKPNAYWDK